MAWRALVVPVAVALAVGRVWGAEPRADGGQGPTRLTIKRVEGDPLPQGALRVWKATSFVIDGGHLYIEGFTAADGGIMIMEEPVPPPPKRGKSGP